MAKKPSDGPEDINILPFSEGIITMALVGTSPIIFNRMSEKAKRDLLMPRAGKMTAADKATNLKHDPVTEFRNSVHTNSGDKPATRLKIPASAVKGSMMTAALDLPGTRKAVIGRLVWVEGDYIDLYGVPQLRMDVVRSADMAKTPDIRTRATCREWCAMITLRFAQPLLKANALANLAAWGGMVSGLGDYRQEKGKGSFGQFRLAQLDDPDFIRIRESGGREAQDAALDKYQCYDSDTEELLEWYHSEILRRSSAPAQQPAKRKARADAQSVEAD